SVEVRRDAPRRSLIRHGRSAAMPHARTSTVSRWRGLPADALFLGAVVLLSALQLWSAARLSAPSITQPLGSLAVDRALLLALTLGLHLLLRALRRPRLLTVVVPAPIALLMPGFPAGLSASTALQLLSEVESVFLDP